MDIASANAMSKSMDGLLASKLTINCCCYCSECSGRQGVGTGRRNLQLLSCHNVDIVNVKYRTVCTEVLITAEYILNATYYLERVGMSSIFVCK